jgi:hypothetical protein
MNVDLGYSDLNIPVCAETSGCLKELVLRAFQLGFQTVALNTVVDQVQFLSCHGFIRKSETVSSSPQSSSYDWVQGFFYIFSKQNMNQCCGSSIFLNRIRNFPSRILVKKTLDPGNVIGDVFPGSGS